MFYDVMPRFSLDDFLSFFRIPAGLASISTIYDVAPHQALPHWHDSVVCQMELLVTGADANFGVEELTYKKSESCMEIFNSHEGSQRGESLHATYWYVHDWYAHCNLLVRV